MNSTSSRPKVSIRLTTYNHEAYIRDTMEGIFMQQINFPVEVVVGDDFSTDKTLEIIRSYKDSQWIRINILKRTKGDIYAEKRAKIGRLFNYYDTLKNCNGQYVALLDGDDYWIDPLKLKKQVDFLDSNNQYALASHEVHLTSHLVSKGFLTALSILSGNFKFATLKYFFNTLGLLFLGENQFWNRRVNYVNISRTYHITLKQALLSKHFMATSSILFRGTVINKLPEWFYQYGGAHYSIIWLSLTEGRGIHFRDFMGIYRKNPTSVSLKKKNKNRAGERRGEVRLIKLQNLKAMVSSEQAKQVDEVISLYQKGSR